MSRYIDADALMNFFTDIPDNFTLTIGNLRATVNGAPSIDIVTCYMCKHSHMTYDGQCKYCDNITDDDGNVIEVYFDADHFCSYGVRNSSEKPNNSIGKEQRMTERTVEIAIALILAVYEWQTLQTERSSE